LNNNLILSVNKISKSFTRLAGAKITVIDNINLRIEKNGKSGQFISVLASFGSGKSTLLKLICGIEKPDSGEILVNGNLLNGTKGEVIFVPEKPSSFPWLNVLENVQFGLEGNKPVQEFIDAVGLTGYEKHYPDNDSIGFRFRISFARALAVNPEIILLDDPFRRMISKTRDEIYDVIRSVMKKYNTTFLLVTTNISEAVYLSNKIYLMKKNPGKIFHEFNIGSETATEMGLNRQERFISLRSEIEKLFTSVGENFQSEIRI